MGSSEDQRAGRPEKRSLCNFCGQRFSASIKRQHLPDCKLKTITRLVGKPTALLYGPKHVPVLLTGVNRQTISVKPLENQAHSNCPFPFCFVLRVTTKQTHGLGPRPKLVISTKSPAKWLKPLRDYFE